MSELLREVVDDCKRGQVSHQEKLYRICSKFLNCSEVSIQEAVYVLLGIPMSKASRETVFINTGEREKRIGVLKSNKDLKILQELDPNSTDIMCKGNLDYYVNRPDELESTCLADFVSMYSYRKKISSSANWDSDEETDNNHGLVEEEDPNTGNSYRLKNNLGFLTPRYRSRIIRYRGYQLEKEPLNFYRERIMLYLPWRDEETDILSKDWMQVFKDNLQQIKDIESKYVYNWEIKYDKIMESVEKDMNEFIAEENDEQIAEEYQVLDLQSNEYDLENEFNPNTNQKNKSCAFLRPIEMTIDTYKDLIRSLNERQRNFLLGLMNHVKTSNEPFHYFLTGGAGCGKSQLIKAVYQTLNKWYNRGGANVDQVKVLLLGPTGKAAFNIRGITIHSGMILF
jgi:hypothetical protein